MADDSVDEQSLLCSSAYVALASSQLGRLVAFYEALLGQAPQPHWPQHYAEFNHGGLKFGIFQPQASHQDEFQADRAGALSLCLEVTNLEQAIDQLTRLGCPPPGPILTASHGREIYAYDPDGNRLILHQSPS
jgi:predicted enzyme related to lactoylglutathione lyase